MTAKEYLNQAYWADRRINSKLEQLASLREMATKTTSIMNGNMVSRSRNLHSMEDTVDKMIDMQAEINNSIDQLTDLKKEIMQVITEVRDPEFQTLLELRYLCFKNWSDIAVEMHCSESNIYRIHSRALRAVKVPVGRQDPKLDSR